MKLHQLNTKIPHVAWERLLAERKRRWENEASRPTLGTIVADALMKQLPPVEGETDPRKPLRAVRGGKSA